MITVSCFVHSTRDGVSASVEAWWLDGGGTHVAYVLQREPLDMETGERNPWVLLAGLWRCLGDRHPSKVSPPGA